MVKSTTVSGAARDSSTSNFYSESFVFDGTNDQITCASSTDFNDISGDFTIEYWVKHTGTGTYQYHFSLDNTTYIYTTWNAASPNGPYLRARIQDGLVYQATALDFQPNQWAHIAMVRSGTGSNNCKLFVNGRVVGQASINTAISESGEILYLGQSSNDEYYFGGNLQDFRIYNGVAKYTSDFVVPSISPDILPDTPSGVSGGSKLTKITDGAVAFDGTSGTSMSIANSTDFNLSTNDFTFQFWVYYTGNGNIYTRYDYPNSNREVSYNAISDGSLQFRVSHDGSNYNDHTLPAGSLRVNAWNYVVLTRVVDGSNSIYRSWVDGKFVLKTTIAQNTVHYGSQTTYIGEYLPGTVNNALNGFLSNFRLINGTALYTSDAPIAVPTAPLTNVTNTKLLTCQSTTRTPGTASYDDAVLIMPMNGSNGGTTFTDISASAHTPSSVAGNTNTSTTQSKFYGSSGYFDGTGDYLDMGDSDDWVPQLGWTVEMWVYITGGSGTQRSLISQSGSGASNQSFQILLQATNKFACSIRYTGTNWADANSNSAIPENQWVHLAVVVESGGTVKLYVDGTAQTETASFSGSGYNTSEEMWIGGQAHPDYPAYFTGYMNDVAMYQTAKYTSNFTPTTTGLLNSQPSIPAAVSPGTVTPNGDAAATNFNPFNTDINTVRGQETGYPTFNPLDSALTLSDGNLNSGTSGASSWKHCRASMAMTTGKFYWEYKAPNGTPDGSNGYMTGVMTNTVSLTADPNSASTGIYGRQHTTKYANGSSSTPFASASNKTIMFALDVDAGLMWTGQDGVWYNSGNPAAGTNESWSSVPAGVLPMGGSYGSSFSVEVNFGQKPFKFSPPDGFQPLNAANTRPVSVIARPDQYVGVTTYNGNGGTQSIDVGHEPDLLWIKNRDDTSQGAHRLFDTVRGSNKTLYPSFDLVEAEVANSLNSFNSNGFTVGSGNWVNGTDDGMVAWSWKAGGSKNTFNVDDVGYASAAAAGLTGGDITPTGASVGTKQGFSIIKFTGSGSGTPSIPHGLSEAPNFIVQKDTGAETSWRLFMYNGATWSIMNFDNASGATGATETAPTSSLFYANGNGNAANTQISYLWHDVPGLQKFGTFEGNGNANGPFLELGFKPAVVILRNLDNYGTGYDWFIFDNQRDKFNVCSRVLLTNSSNNESSSNSIDFLSNGFKIRATTNGINLNSHTIFYAAWAEAPSVDLYGGGANAR